MRSVVFVVLAGLSAAAHAQIGHSITTFSAEGSEDAVLSENLIGNILFEPDLFRVQMVGAVTMRPGIEAGTRLRRVITTRGHFETGLIPIRLHHLENFHRVSHTIGGGTSENPRSTSRFSTRLYAYTDVNQNGVWEFDEPRGGAIFTLGAGVSGTVISQNGSGTNTRSGSGGALIFTNLTLATLSSYFLETQIETLLNTNDAIVPPPLPTFTHIFNNGGYDAQVRYSLVPEPATMAVLGFGSLWLARRRKCKRGS